MQPRLAIGLDDSPLVDLLDAWSAATGTRLDWDEAGFLVSYSLLIEDGPGLWSEVRDIVGTSVENPELTVNTSDAGFRLVAPLDRLASLRDFLAFEDHVKRGARRRGLDVPDYWYEAPVYYKGNHRAILGPGDECRWPAYTSALDFELEMAMIVGKRGRDIDADNAGSYIFGYSVLNDFSARDIQGREMNAWLGPAKGKDFANAIGPCILTSDEVGPDPDLEMICRVNGEEWGRARSTDMHWSWRDMIAHVSRSEDIYPVDVYGSGTPGGCCGLDQGRALEPGDIVELEIEKIGVLRNPIGVKPLA